MIGVKLYVRQPYTLRPVTSQQSWDTFVSSHPRGHLLQSWGWGELKAGAGWHPLRLFLWDNEQNRPVAAAQILRRTVAFLPPGIGHLAYIPKGPVLDDLSLAAPFFRLLHPYLRRHGAIALQVEAPYTVDEPDGLQCAAWMKQSGFSQVGAVQPLRTILLDLTPDEETLLARMKEKWRYNVRLAARKGVHIRAATSEDDVRSWYRILQTTSERDAFGIHTKDYYLRVWRIFAPQRQARLFLAEKDGQLLAGIFVGLLAKQAIYLYGASSNELRQLMPNYLLQWEAIRWAKSEGAICYDFWGIPATDDENEAMAGVYRFKSGWGGSIGRFVGTYQYAYHPLVMRVARRLLPSFM